MADKRMPFARLLARVGEIVDGPGSRDDKLIVVCRLLHDNVDHYHWVGFYIADESKRELNLGPYVGKPTEHTRIPFGAGICGRAAEILETYISQDVYKEVKYLPCSKAVKAEMVVPIIKDGHMLAELDIDSHAPAPFTEDDKTFLEDVCGKLAGLF